MFFHYFASFSQNLAFIDILRYSGKIVLIEKKKKVKWSNNNITNFFIDAYIIVFVMCSFYFTLVYKQILAL